ncbi:MAG: tRNA (adenosine(37)-N6)-threonylcarbamoyltransferase complex ATPase subunit type 1 TsaE [Holophagaceae bacterium]|nr:tRNA (adenosine(37)-N6)-threonylcarbamoyltransferase complex ATPase subunit type 1 TsaE [Holophagaceae bacterium]
MIYLASEEETENLGAELAKQTPAGGTWLLQGELGAGKTTWTRGFVQGLGGQQEQVSSPTYSVLHSYEVHGGKVYHLDLYRLGTEGIWTLGLEDILTMDDWLVAEWAGNSGQWQSGWVSLLELSPFQDGRNANWHGSIIDKNG